MSRRLSYTVPILFSHLFEMLTMKTALVRSMTAKRPLVMSLESSPMLGCV